MTYVVIIGFVAVVGLHAWAAQRYTQWFDHLPAEEKARMQRALAYRGE